jgi:hypothetical protein
VDRLTTGRRHARAGSVTVTELLTRQATATHCTDSSPAAEPDEDNTDVIPVVFQATHRREPARAAQVAKLASLGVAGVVLCGAVAISSFITNQRRENAESAVRPSVQITGEQALLPDVLDRTLPADPTTSAPVPAAPPAVERPPATPAPAETRKAPPAGDSGTSASESTVTVGPASDIELVREFYENLPDSPLAAFKLLSTDGLDMELGEFLSSWSMVSRIDSVDVVQRADGVLATVRMRLTDGGQLRVEQLLTVAESPRRIVGVQLLSAQRH